MVAPPQAHAHLSRAAHMLDHNTAGIPELPMHGKIHLLTYTNLGVRQCHDQQGLVGVPRIVAHRQIAVPLTRVQRLPWNRNPEIRGPLQTGAITHHCLQIGRGPQAIFKRRILRDIGPQATINRVSDWLQEAAEKRRRQHLWRLATGDSQMDHVTVSISRICHLPTSRTILRCWHQCCKADCEHPVEPEVHRAHGEPLSSIAQL